MKNVGVGYFSQDYNTAIVTYLSPHTVSQANHQSKKKMNTKRNHFKEKKNTVNKKHHQSPPGQSPQYNYVKNIVDTTKKDSIAFLGLSTRGTWCERHIRSLYLREARKRHPDKNPDNRKEVTEDFQLLQAAYNYLLGKD